MTDQLELDASQLAAVSMAEHEPISIITGGPGTGKTTIVRELLSRLSQQSHPPIVSLCAPTGKAAKRMEEATGQNSKTIHRLLAYNPESGFWYGVSEKLPCDVVIVDEASMIDVELFSYLLNAIDERRTRLILVGDFNQLPSVGPGSILVDLVNSNLVPIARLTQVHRSAAKSWMCANAPRILKGESLALHRTKDFRFVEVESSGNVPQAVGDELERLDDSAGTQVLVPQRTGPAGADVLNETLQQRFNTKTGDSWRVGKTTELRVGDPVIHTKNNYDLGVYNGECGWVESMTRKHLHVRYPDRQYPVEYNKSDAQVLRLSYALTVHKSQGSEWPWAVVVVHSSHTYMLTRQLVYTAVTRGKAGVIIVGNSRGIENALKCQRDNKRNTALCDRILAGSEGL